MKFYKDIKQCKIWLGVICFFIFFEGGNFGFSLYRYITEGKGIGGAIISAVGAIILSLCVLQMCRIIARYHVMNCEAAELESRMNLYEQVKEKWHIYQ